MTTVWPVPVTEAPVVTTFRHGAQYGSGAAVREVVNP